MSGAERDAVIRVRGLKNQFGTHVVHEDLDLDVYRGEILGVVGGSGTGKSVLLRTITGLQTPAAGEIEVFGVDVLGRGAGRDSLDDRWGVMFQDGALFSSLTVRENIEVPMKAVPGLAPDIRRALADLKISMVGLPYLAGDLYPSDLSGGMRKRAGLARALALDPKLLIADEPTAGLDMSVQGEVLNLLAEVQARSGVAIVIITHNLNLVRHVTDQMAIMYLGRFVEQGPTEQVFAHPRHPYTKALLAANPEPDPEARQERVALSGEVPSPVDRPSGCDFHPRCPWARESCAAREPDWSVEDSRGHRCLFPL